MISKKIDKIEYDLIIISKKYITKKCWKIKIKNKRDLIKSLIS